MNGVVLSEARRTLAGADLIHDEARVQSAVRRMAARITGELADLDPILVCVMNGGLVPAALLMPHLDFPFRLDYLHATRYRDRTSGGELSWERQPERSFENEHLLIVDDILDEGYTLEAILKHCKTCKPASVRAVVLFEKQHDRGVRPALACPGLEVPDRYVFGCGMDYKGYWRNLPAVYAVAENETGAH